MPALRLHPIARLVRIACLLGMTTTTQAQTPPPAPVVELPATVVRSGAERDDRAEAISNKVVVTRDDINRQGDTTLSDVLGRVPGVTVTGSGLRGGEVRLRGLGSGYVAILINGDPTPQGFSLDSISPVLIERIEVNRSPTADRSAQAIAGSINIILKQSARAGQRDVKLTGGSVGGRGQYALSGQYGDRLNDKTWGVVAEYRHDAFPDGENTRRQWTNATGQLVRDVRLSTTRPFAIDNISLAPRLNWFLTDADTLFVDTLLGFERVHAYRDDGYQSVLGTPADFPTVHVSQRSDTVNTRARGTWEHRFDQGAKLETKLGANASRLNQMVHHRFYDEPGTLQLDRAIDGPLVDTGQNVGTKYTSPWSTGHVLSAGWEAERAQRENGRIQNELAPTGLVTPVNLEERFRAHVSRWAAYAQDEWTLHPGWSAYGGLRWETVETGGNDGDDVFRQRTHVLSPILQSAWQVPGTPNDKLRLALSRTYRQPSLRELSPRRYYNNSQNTPTSPETQGNPQLKPELAWGLDLGYERTLSDDAGLLSANATWRHIHDAILPEVRYDTQLNSWIQRPVNDGDARVLSVDVEARLRLRKLWPTAPAVEARANVARNLSWVDAVPGPDNRVVRQNPLTAGSGLDWRPDGSAWSFGGTYTLSRYGLTRMLHDQTYARAVSRKLDAYALWRIDAASQLRVSGTNLLHPTQSEVATFPLADVAGNDLRQDTLWPTYAAIRLVYERKL